MKGGTGSPSTVHAEVVVLFRPRPPAAVERFLFRFGVLIPAVCYSLRRCVYVNGWRWVRVEVYL